MCECWLLGTATSSPAPGTKASGLHGYHTYAYEYHVAANDLFFDGQSVPNQTVFGAAPRQLKTRCVVMLAE